jgi:hypothetical protein
MDPLTLGLVLGGADLLGGIFSSIIGGNAASDAADAQSQAAMAGVAEQRRQFDEMKKILQPFVTAGTTSTSLMADIAGANGPEAQKKALEGISSSEEVNALIKSGEEGILQNAAATGGLRGGNTEAALATFRPSIVSKAISDKFSRLGSLATLGQASAAGVGAAGIQTGQGISALLEQAGAAQAGGILGAAQNNPWNAITKAIGTGFGVYTGAGGTFGVTPQRGILTPYGMTNAGF